MTQSPDHEPTVRHAPPAIPSVTLDMLLVRAGLPPLTPPPPEPEPVKPEPLPLPPTRRQRRKAEKQAQKAEPVKRINGRTFTVGWVLHTSFFFGMPLAFYWIAPLLGRVDPVWLVFSVMVVILTTANAGIVTIRLMADRLHDLYRPSGLLLLYFIPVIDLLFLWRLMSEPSYPSATRHGPMPAPKKINWQAVFWI